MVKHPGLSRSQLVTRAAELLALNRTICESKPYERRLGVAAKRFLSRLIEWCGATEIHFVFDAIIRETLTRHAASLQVLNTVTLYADDRDGLRVAAFGHEEAPEDCRRLLQGHNMFDDDEFLLEAGRHDALVEHLRFDRAPLIRTQPRGRRRFNEYWWENAFAPREAVALRAAFAGLLWIRAQTIAGNHALAQGDLDLEQEVKRVFERELRRPYELYKNDQPDMVRPWFPQPDEQWSMEMGREIWRKSLDRKFAVLPRLIPLDLLKAKDGLERMERIQWWLCADPDGLHMSYDDAANVLGIGASTIRGTISRIKSTHRAPRGPSGEQGRDDKSTKTKKGGD